jgi:hypothetical protein
MMACNQDPDRERFRSDLNRPTTPASKYIAKMELSGLRRGQNAASRGSTLPTSLISPKGPVDGATDRQGFHHGKSPG